MYKGLVGGPYRPYALEENIFINFFLFFNIFILSRLGCSREGLSGSRVQIVHVRGGLGGAGWLSFICNGPTRKLWKSD